MSKRGEQLDAFITQKSFALEQVQYFVSEQLLRSNGIDVGEGKPLSLAVPNTTRGEAVSMRVYVQNTSKALRHRHDAGTSFVFAHSFEHQLLDGLISESG